VTLFISRVAFDIYLSPERYLDALPGKRGSMEVPESKRTVTQSRRRDPGYFDAMECVSEVESRRSSAVCFPLSSLYSCKDLCEFEFLLQRQSPPRPRR